MKLLSAASIIPLTAMQAATTSAWDLIRSTDVAPSLSDEYVSTMFDTPLRSMLRRRNKMMEQAFSGIPVVPLELSNLAIKNQRTYEIITDNDQEFKVAFKVPNMDISDVHVSLDDNNKILKVSGSRESKDDGYFFNSKFSQSISVDPTLNRDKLSAQLENGVLTIAAPKDVKKLASSVREIPIQSSSSNSSNNKDGDEDDGTVRVKNSIKSIL